ncbi:MAG: 6-bladed beta-propeller [Bacteroidota bacterium]
MLSSCGESVDDSKIFKGIKYNVIKQSDNNRVYAAKLKTLKSIKLSVDGIYRPMLMEVTNANDIYIFDIERKEIAYYKREDSTYLSPIFIGGEGKGPTEFMNPVDMKIFDDKLYVADAVNKRLVVYSKKGDFLDNYKTGKENIHRIVPLSANSMIVNSSTLPGNYLFKTYNFSDGEDINKFGVHDNISMFYTEGFVERYKKSIVFYPIGLNKFYRFGDNGDIVFARELIKKGSNVQVDKEPKRKKGEVLIQRRPKDFKYINGRFSINGDDIFSLYCNSERGVVSNTIDIYSAENGDYKYSINTDHPTLDISVNDDILVAKIIKDKEYFIEVYEINK